MPLTKEQSEKLHRLQKEIKEVRSIMLKIMRTEDSDGCYNPFNTGFEYLCDTVHEVRELLKAKLESNKQPKVLVKLN